MSTLPQSAEEFPEWIVGFLPESIQPYAGFLIALIVVIVGVITFFQPIIALFKKEEPFTPATGDASLDALLTLDARGQLTGAHREQLTIALLTRISQPDSPSGQNAAENQSKRVIVERLIEAPASAEKSDTLATLLTDPAEGLDQMMETATTAQDYVDTGILAMGFDAARASLAFERALALEPENLDATYQSIRLRALSEGASNAINAFEALLPKTEQVRPDLTVLILLKLARQANMEDRWQDAMRQYRRAISIAEATHDMARLAAACHASAEDILSAVNPLLKEAPDDLPHWLLDDAEEMLDKAAEAMASSSDVLPHEEVSQLLGRANIAQIKTDFDDAKALVNKACDRAKQAGDRLSEARCLALLAIIQHKTFKLFAAIDTIDEAIAIMENVMDGVASDPDIPNAAFLRLKGDLLFQNAQYDDALIFYRRAYAASEASGAFDESSQAMLDNAIFHCRYNGSEGFTEEEKQAAREELDAITETEENGSAIAAPGSDQRMRESQLALIAGLFDEDQNDALSDDDADDEGANPDEPFFTAEEDEKLDKASSLYVSGKDRFENEDWESALFALERARDLFLEIDAMPPSTDEEIQHMLSVCAAKLA
jgi:tetratricopeptide (TPR) repeat protein